jgi:alkylresorcinol/alkylpyrone synthase
MFIVGLGTAAPPRRYAQRECWELVQHIKAFQELQPRSRAIIRKVLTGNNGITTRHLALESLDEAFELTPDALNRRFTLHAPELATLAAQQALSQAGVKPTEVDALLISTCTGYLCPGLTSYVAERLGTRPDVLTLDLVGQGCGAALPNLRAAEALLSAGRCDRVLSICVEVCSAAFYMDNDPGVLISACLFGDGAGAAVLSREPNGHRKIEWKLSGSRLNPADRELLRFEQKDGMLRNILSAEVPQRAAAQVGSLLQGMLTRAQLGKEKIRGWVLHPGGRDVLVALQERLELSPSDTRWSAAVLEEYGNLSSPSVFFVLERALAEGAPGGYWWMSSFGAGFSAHGAVLEVEGKT